MAPRQRPAQSPRLFEDDASPKRASKKKRDPNPVVAECFTLFAELHQAKHGIPARFVYGKDGKHFGDLLATYGRDEVIALMQKMFSTGDPRIVASDYTVGAFFSLAPHLALLDRRNGPKDRRAAENFDAASRATQRKTDIRKN